MDLREVIELDNEVDVFYEAERAVVRVGDEEVEVFCDEPCNEMPLAAVAPESAMTVFPRRGKRIPGVVVENPEWLPSGWMTEMKIRKSGSSAGNRDKYFFEIATGKKCRSKLEVFRYLDPGLFTMDVPELQSIPDSPTPALPSPDCCRPTYYYQPVLCESPVYAEHPGLFPVVYFPVIGDSPEDQFKPPPMDILANMQLKPIFSRPAHNVPSPPDYCQQHLGNVEDRFEKNKKPRIVSELAESNAAEALNSLSSWDGKCCGDYAVNGSTPHSTSLALSCNISSHFRVNNAFKARTKATNPVRMRGHLSEARLLALKKDFKL